MSSFEKLLDKATNNWLFEPDWPAIIQICDLIRQGVVHPTTALNAIKKKLNSQDRYTPLHALQLLESMVKNCGAAVHDEVTTKQFCEMLHDLTKTTPHENFRQKLLKLIQSWNFAFFQNPKHANLKEVMTEMEAEGFKFPTLQESDAMFTADTVPVLVDGEVCHCCCVKFGTHTCGACGQIFCGNCLQKSMNLPKVCNACYNHMGKPNAIKTASNKEHELPSDEAMLTADAPPKWADGSVCHCCHVQFGIVRRKNHCRACGQVFCNQCSLKTMSLPQFGIEKEVRVCDACYDHIGKPNAIKTVSNKEHELPSDEAMFTADAPPKWADGSVCHCCHVQFGIVRRKNHCRVCGQVFCNQCSQKTMSLPQFGIEKEVRVCDACYDHIGKPNAIKTASNKEHELPSDEAMFTADAPPKWADGSVCHCCHVQFGIVRRKNHCRVCGQVFCNQCSQKTMSLPQFGIEKEVRVCDACYDHMGKPNAIKTASNKEQEPPSNEVMFTADAPPKWADGSVCHCCHVQFEIVRRKNHCRTCGQVFCNQCSQKTMSLPQFGIEKEVRVCDACYDHMGKPNAIKTASNKEQEPPSNEVMFTADASPKWADGSVCHCCHVQFEIVRRKNHCRTCGQVFCNQCSQKTMSLPQFGIEKEVRVCDACYDQFAQQKQVRPHKNENEFCEEEELQLALALSQSQIEPKEEKNDELWNFF